MAFNVVSFNQFLPGVVTPDAYGIGRYGRIPVNRFSGLPNINIPLTEVRGRGYKLPVSLQYYGGGIKVEQHPGCVGLGWSLMAGGRITRVIHGSHDELDMGSTEKRGYLYHMDETQKTKDWNDDTVLSELTDQMDQTDYDPDEYIVNVDGLSASFYLTGENEIAIVSLPGYKFGRGTQGNKVCLHQILHPQRQKREQVYLRRRRQRHRVFRQSDSFLVV